MHLCALPKCIDRFEGTAYLCNRTPSLDILFSSNHNIHKSSNGHRFWASDPLIERFQENLSSKGSEAQKQRPYELL